MSSVDEWVRLMQTHQQPPAAIPTPQPEPMGNLKGFGLSALSSVPELVGIGPKTTFGDVLGGQIEDWRAENPWKNVGSQLLGLAVPYVGAFKAGNALLKAVPTTQRVLAGVEAAAVDAPIRSAMIRETLPLLPFEAGRIVGAAAVGDEGSLDDVALSAGLDLALTPLTVGAFKAVGRMLPEVEFTPQQKLAQQVEGFDANRPAQEILRDAYAMKARGVPEELSKLLDSTIATSEQSVRLEGAKSRKMAEPFFKDDAETQNALRNLISPSTKEAKRFIVSPEYGFADDAAWKSVRDEVGLPEDWLSYMQFPRLVEATEKTGPSMQKVLKKMLPAQDGWAIARSADEDMYLVAKKLDEKRWFVGTTNEPEKFIKKDFIQRQSEKLAKFAASAQKKFDEKAAQAVFNTSPDSILAAAKSYEAAIPPRFSLAQRGKTVGEKALEMAEQAFPGIKTVTNKVVPQMERVVQGTKQFVAPAMHQFRNAPLAEWTRNAAQNIYANAEVKASKILFGEQGLKPDMNVKQKLLANADVGGLQKTIANLKDEDMSVVTTLLHEPRPVDEIREVLRGLLPEQKERISKFIDELHTVQQNKWNELTATRAYAGETAVDPLKDRLIPHAWKGDWRQRVVDSRGKTIFMGAGKTREEAQRTAKAFIDHNGGRLDGKSFQQGREEDLADALAVARQQKLSAEYKLGKGPELKTLRERLDVKGSLGWEQPLTKQELNDIIVADIRSGYKHIADMVVRKELGHWFPEVLARYGTAVTNGLVNRVNSMSGIQGKFSRWQNVVADKALGNILGNNSASKLVAGLNEFEAHWNLMGLNLANSAINALTFVQTVLPKISLLKSVPAARWHEFMDIAPAIGSDGTPRGIVQMPSVPKLVQMGWRAITNPTPEQRKLISRAIGEGVVAPRFLEEFVGQKSYKAFAVRKQLVGRNPVYEGLKELSSWLPTKVEEFTRAHAFMIGENIGRVAGFQDEQLYQFAKQFTYRTMYQYSTADRPRIFTGPLGSSVGLFKNWMFHNFADFSQYGGELARGNYAPMLWALSGYASLAGVGGLPFYGLLDASQKVFTDKNLMEQVYDAFGGVNIASDAAFYGLPSLVNTSLQAQAQGMFNNPARDVSALFSAASADRVARIGKFLGHSWDQYLAGGVSPFGQDRTWDLAAYALGPRSLYKAIGQIEDGSLKAVSNGAPIISGIGNSEYFRNILGFTPLTVARAYEASEQIWQDQERRKALVADLGEAYSQAMLRQDSKVMNHVILQAVSHGLDLTNVMKSAQSRLAAQFQDQIVKDARKDPAAMARLGLYGLL